MPVKDLHNEPFDDMTIAKLEIFEDYAQAWIPTFVMQATPEIHIFDFFAGTGYDKNGVPGSPIRILKKVLEQKGNLFKKNTTIVIHLNEFNPQKFEELRTSCNSFIENDSVKNRLKLRFYNEDFEKLFPKLLPKIQSYPALVYLDQNGIKFLSEKYFLELEKISQTDFLYFVSSSYIWRFGESEEFKLHLDIDMQEAKKQGYKKIHRSITEHLRKKLPKNSTLKLRPFSLKKGKNIHGIIFGAKHPLAVDKFLGIAWKRNEDNGDANFDIDDEALNGQLDLFKGQQLSKIDAFKKEVAEKILSGQITSNIELLEFTYDSGHIPKHAAEVVKELKQQKRIDFIGNSPLVTYQNAYRLKKKLTYTLITRK